MTKEQWEEKLKTTSIRKLVKFNDWGSFQYDEASAFYSLYLKMRKDLNEKDVMDLLEINFKYRNIKSFDVIKKILIKDLEKWIKKSIEEYNEPEGKDNSYYNDLQELKKAKTFDDIFINQRHQSRDLWTAVPQICKLLFSSMKLVIDLKPYTFGPEWNQKVQLYNYEVGFLCAYLKDKGYVKS